MTGFPWRRFFPALAVSALLAHPARSQRAPSDGELARATSDPSSDIWALFTEAEFTVDPARPFSKSNRFTLELQPTLPVTFSRGWRLLNFPELVLSTEGTPGGAQIAGIQSFSYLAALAPVPRATGLAWGLGPYASAPVVTDAELAASQWQFGAGGILSWREPRFLAATIVKSGWTTAGTGDEAGALQIQYTAQYFFGNGAQIGIGRPVIEYTWNRHGGGGWDIPVGVDIARIFHVGRLPVKIMLEYDFTPINDSRWQPEHTFRLTVVPILPSPLGHPEQAD